MKQRYDVIIYAHDFTYKIYYGSQIIMWLWSTFFKPCDQGLVIPAFLGEKLSWPQFDKDLTRKTNIFKGHSWLKFSDLRLTLVVAFKILHQCDKRIKTESQKVFGANFYVWQLYMEKNGRTGKRGSFWVPLNLNRVKMKYNINLILILRKYGMKSLLK